MVRSKATDCESIYKDGYISHKRFRIIDVRNPYESKTEFTIVTFS